MKHFTETRFKSYFQCNEGRAEQYISYREYQNRKRALQASQTDAPPIQTIYDRNNELLDSLLDALPENAGNNGAPPTIPLPPDTLSEKEVMEAGIEGVVQMEQEIPSSDPKYRVIDKHSDVRMRQGVSL